MGKRKELEAQVKLLEARLVDMIDPGTVKPRWMVIADMARAMKEAAEATTITMTHGYCGIEQTAGVFIEGISPWGLLAEAALRGMTEGVPEESEYTTFRHGERGSARELGRLVDGWTAEDKVAEASIRDTESDYQRFLSHSHLRDRPALRQAYYAGVNAGPYHEDGSFERACRETFGPGPAETGTAAKPDGIRTRCY
jgi:hypothetical protein